MKNFTFSYHFSPIPPIMKRGRHALIVIKTEDGKYMLGGKTIYPEGIYRFIGGGIDANEPPILGAAREVEEELQLHVEPAELKELAQLTVNVSDGKETFVFETFLFLLELSNDKKPIASDDVQSLIYLTKTELLALAERYTHLPSDLISVGTDVAPEKAFRWSDYGQFYGELHRIAVELTA